MIIFFAFGIFSQAVDDMYGVDGAHKGWVEEYDDIRDVM